MVTISRSANFEHSIGMKINLEGSHTDAIKWRSQPIRSRIGDHQPIVGRLESISFEYHIRKVFQIDGFRIALLANRIDANSKSANQSLSLKHQFENLP